RSCTGPMDHVAVASNGMFVAGSANDAILLWNRSENRQDPLVAGGTVVNGLSFSPDSKLLAAASGNGYSKVWDTATKKELFTTRPRGAAKSVVFSPNGRYRAAISDAFQLWVIRGNRDLEGLAGQDLIAEACGRIPTKPTIDWTTYL